MILFFIDLTITTEKLVELFGTLDNRLVDSLRLYLNLPSSKNKEVWHKFFGPDQRRDAYLDIYVSDHPCPSWKAIANTLRSFHLQHLCDVVERTYVQGVIITLTAMHVCVCLCVSVCA